MREAKDGLPFSDLIYIPKLNKLNFLCWKKQWQFQDVKTQHFSIRNKKRKFGCRSKCSNRARQEKDEESC